MYDNTSTILFVAPKSGSKQAANVNTTLNIPFIVVANQPNRTNIEVVSAEGLQASDVGMEYFVIKQVKTIIFTLSVLDSATRLIVPNAILQVLQSNCKTYQDTINILNKYVQLKDTLDYILNISANRYNPRNIRYTKNGSSRQK